MIPPLNPHEKFKEDPAYNRVVKILEGVLFENMLSPYEVRVAAMQAVINVEMMRSRRHVITPHANELYQNLMEELKYNKEPYDTKE